MKFSWYISFLGLALWHYYALNAVSYHDWRKAFLIADGVKEKIRLAEEVDDRGRPFFMSAISNSDNSLVEEMLSLAPTLAFRSFQGVAPYQLALYRDNRPIIEALELRGGIYSLNLMQIIKLIAFYNGKRDDNGLLKFVQKLPGTYKPDLIIKLLQTLHSSDQDLPAFKTRDLLRDTLIHSLVENDSLTLSRVLNRLLNVDDPIPQENRACTITIAQKIIKYLQGNNPHKYVYISALFSPLTIISLLKSLQAFEAIDLLTNLIKELPVNMLKLILSLLGESRKERNQQICSLIAEELHHRQQREQIARHALMLPPPSRRRRREPSPERPRQQHHAMSLSSLLSSDNDESSSATRPVLRLTAEQHDIRTAIERGDVERIRNALAVGMVPESFMVGPEMSALRYAESFIDVAQTPEIHENHEEIVRLMRKNLMSIERLLGSVVSGGSL